MAPHSSPPPHSFRSRHLRFTGRYYGAGVTATVVQSAPTNPQPPSTGAHPSRPTPARVQLITASLIAAALALLAVTAASFIQARSQADTVNSRARTAAQAGDLYFALADLDSEAARLVLLGDGDFQTVSGAYDGNQLSALIAYNDRTAQVDTDLQALAADGASSTAIAAGVTQYRSIADASIGLDEFPGAPAGQPLGTSIGFYSRATTMMQDVVLPAASQLRNQTAAEASQAADSAHTWAIVGLIGTLVLGVLAVLVLVRAQRRFTVMFRRTVNPALFAATLVAAALLIGAAIGLASTAQDASDSGSRLAAYLQVVVTRADSYDVDGTAVRSVLMPDAFNSAQVDPKEQIVDGDLTKLGSAGGAAAAIWSKSSKGPVADYQTILNAVAGGDTAQALTVETGTARGDAAFDFYNYDQSLQTLGTERLADFQSAASGLSSDVSPWLYWPWILAGVTLLLIAVAVRPRLAEYR